MSSSVGLGLRVTSHGESVVPATKNGIFQCKHLKTEEKSKRTCLTLPWEEEDDATIGSGWIEQAHLLRAVVAGKHDVDTGAWAANLLYVRVVHLADAVSEGTGGIDDALGFDGPLPFGQVVTQLGSAEHFLSASVLLLQ